MIWENILGKRNGEVSVFFLFFFSELMKLRLFDDWCVKGLFVLTLMTFIGF